VLSNGVSTLWINPAAETDPAVTAPDAVTNLTAVTAYAFREDGSEGNSLVDDLVIATTFKDALGVVVAIPLSGQLLGANLVLSWTDATFSLQSATNVAGPYSTIVGAASPFTNTTAVQAMFFRLQHP
jgi:hypothetical protein